MSMPPDILESLASPSAGVDELNCPLCGYDLHGLPENRCPECGHAFDLDDLRAAKRDQRDWLFEHAPRQLTKAFGKTTLATLRPFKFWKRLSAVDVIVGRRLNLWARVWLAIGGLFVVGSFALAVVLDYIEMNSVAVGRGYPKPSPLTAVFMDSNDGWSAAVRDILYGQGLTYLTFAILGATIWPAVVVLALQCFGMTLRRAGIRPGHLWRCVLYPWPVVAVPVVAISVACCFGDFNQFTPVQWPLLNTVPIIVWQVGRLMHLTSLALIAMSLSFLIGGVYLVAAHTRYLRLPHAVAQAILVQVIAALAILVLIGVLSGGLLP